MDDRMMERHAIAYRLHMTVEEMGHRLSSDEYAMWREFFKRTEPGRG